MTSLIKKKTKGKRILLDDLQKSWSAQSCLIASRFGRDEPGVAHSTCSFSWLDVARVYVRYNRQCIVRPIFWIQSWFVWFPHVDHFDCIANHHRHPRHHVEPVGHRWEGLDRRSRIWHRQPAYARRFARTWRSSGPLMQARQTTRSRFPRKRRGACWGVGEGCVMGPEFIFLFFILQK